jgi:hypothetical protein
MYVGKVGVILPIVAILVVIRLGLNRGLRPDPDGAPVIVQVITVTSPKQSLAVLGIERAPHAWQRMRNTAAVQDCSLYAEMYLACPEIRAEPCG